MIEYKIIEINGENVTLETKNTSKKSFSGETVFVHKTMKKVEALEMLGKVITERQQQLAALSQKVNEEIGSAQAVIDVLNA